VNLVTPHWVTPTTLATPPTTTLATFTLLGQCVCSQPSSVVQLRTADCICTCNSVLHTNKSHIIKCLCSLPMYWTHMHGVYEAWSDDSKTISQYAISSSISRSHRVFQFKRNPPHRVCCTPLELQSCLFNAVSQLTLPPGLALGALGGIMAGWEKLV